MTLKKFTKSYLIIVLILSILAGTAVAFGFPGCNSDSTGQFLACWFGHTILGILWAISLSLPTALIIGIIIYYRNKQKTKGKK